MWQVTAEPQRFDEASEWFSRRVVITGDQAKGINADVKQRAFWVGGGLQLEQIQRVFDELRKAQDSGEPFEQWRKRVRDTLRDDAHAETVFRNAAQRAYNAGRWQQMNEPDVAQFRPYFMYDAVLDSRTTELCRSLDSTILPADHPFWKTHVPPLHHRCRSGIRNLRRREAERRGITELPPELEPEEGFGLAPEPDKDIWTPDPAKHDARLVRELERKKSERDAREREVPPSTPRPSRQRRTQANPQHEPKTWRKDYERYGSAALPMAYGRALNERMMDRPWGETVARIKELKAAGHPMFDDASIEQLEGLFTKVDKPRKRLIPTWARGYALIAEHTLSIDTGGRDLRQEFELTFTGRNLDQALKFWETMADKSVQFPPGLRIEERDGRASYVPAKNTIYVSRESPVSLIAHEIGHAAEVGTHGIYKASLAFRRVRTAGNELRPLRDITGNQEFLSNEMAWEDKFVNPYVGKSYKGKATEVHTIGVQALIEAYDQFEAGDREHFLLTLGQLANATE